MRKTSLAAAGVKLSALTLCSRVLGLIREMTKAAFLGTSALADAFGVAFMLPNLFRRLFAENSVSVAFIPTFRGYLEKNSKEETQEFINATFTLVSFLTAVVVVLGIIAAPFIVPLFADENSGGVLDEMTLLTRIMFPYLFVISIAALLQGILNSLKIFSPSGLTPVFFNLIVILSTYLLSPFFANPARAMSVGVILGGTVQALFQLPFVIKNGWLLNFTSLKKAFTNPGTKKVIALVLPTVIGMAAYQLNDVVSTSLAGKAGTGVVSSLQYSLRLQELILGIFAVSIGTVILPDLSGLAQSEKWEEFNRMLGQAVKIIALITIPVTFFALVYGENIIKLVYQSKRFTDESVLLTKQAFEWHIAGLYFIALNRIMAPAFYAQGNTKLPTLAGILGFVVNMILASILVNFFAGSGIAFALSAASFANTVLLFAFLKKCPNVSALKIAKSTLAYTLKLVLLSVIATVPVWYLRPVLLAPFAHCNRFIAQGVPLAIAVCIFAVIGVALLLLTKDPVIAVIKNAVLRKLGRGKNTAKSTSTTEEN